MIFNFQNNFLDMKPLISPKKPSGSAVSLEWSSSGCGVKMSGTGPLIPPMPSKASDVICHVARTTTGISSCLFLINVLILCLLLEFF